MVEGKRLPVELVHMHFRSQGWPASPVLQWARFENGCLCDLQECRLAASRNHHSHVQAWCSQTLHAPMVSACVVIYVITRMHVYTHAVKPTTCSRLF